MARKLSVKFQLTQDEVQYVERYQDAHHLSSRSAAMEYILEEHRHKSDISATEFLSEHLAERLGAFLMPELKKLRLGVNHNDRNTQINMLLLNTLLGYSGMLSLTTGDTPQLAAAREEVTRRIAAARVKALGRDEL